MASKTDFITLLARTVSVLLGIGAAVTATTAVVSFFVLGPDSGATGVVLVDSVFGTFILFVASRFLWIYAAKRASRASDGGTSELT